MPKKIVKPKTKTLTKTKKVSKASTVKPKKVKGGLSIEVKFNQDLKQYLF